MSSIVQDHGPVGGGGGGATDVTSGAVIADNAVVRGDGGARGVQGSLVTVDDNGTVTIPNGQSFTVHAGNGVGIYNSLGLVLSESFNAVGRGSLNSDSYLISNQSAYIGGGATPNHCKVHPPKTLTDATATTIGTVSLPTLTAASGVMHVKIWARDATDVQCRTQIVRWEAVNKGGVYSTAITIVSEGVQVSVGTLTAAWTITTGSDLINLRVTADSSLTPTTLEAHIISDGMPGVTPV